GIKYIWTERLTNIIGQGVSLSPKAVFNIFDPACPVDSLKTMLKTVAKIIVSFAGSEKYDYFKGNDLLIVSELRDKQRIYEFVRFNNYFKSPENGDSFEELYYLISPRVLTKLKQSGGYAVVYVHLGKNYNLQSADAVKTVNALKNLKMENESGNIYVDSTSKVLEYYLTHKHLNWSWKSDNDKCIITVHSVDDPVNGTYVPSLQQLSNITFYVSYPHIVELYCGSEKVQEYRQNPEDHTGMRSITIV
ncbi:MAG: hypothetical protein H8D23_41330, partial [Candidatus Brocadiales bacterium]|nr:hypothetical protein [Candidatus Brocadiales bacterium]